MAFDGALSILNQCVEKMALDLLELLKDREALIRDKYPDGIPEDQISFSSSEELNRAIFAFLQESQVLRR